MGRLRFGHEWDWTGAEKDFRRALEIDPNNLDAHFFSAMLFMALGRFAESIAHIERAEQLDPLSSTVHSAFGRVLYRARKFDQAIPHLNQAIALEPRSSDAYGRLADVYEALGRYDEALALYEKLHVLRGRPMRGPDIAIVFARMGKRDEANRILMPLRETSQPSQLAQAYAVLGNNDEAFRFLFRHAEERNSLNYVKTEPRFDRLHLDPRWQLLLRRMNFPVGQRTGHNRQMIAQVDDWFVRREWSAVPTEEVGRTRPPPHIKDAAERGGAFRRSSPSLARLATI